MKIKKVLIIIFLFILSFSDLYGQGRLYDGPVDPAGDQSLLREGHMEGNRWRIYFNNQGRTGHWPFLDGSKFPADSPFGLDMFDTKVLIVGARVYLENDTIPITDLNDIQSRPPGELDTLYYALSANALTTDRSPDGTVEWTFQPVYGYFNINSESPAISTDPGSWPTEGWPSSGYSKKWPGKWNGRFGPFPYAHMEGYFVTNDAQDQENIQPGRRVRYYPRGISNVRIGDLWPDITTQYGLPWGGIGLRVAVRIYQWNNPQTRDIAFWEHDITNISDYDLPEVVFGEYIDMGIGNYMSAVDEDNIGSYNAKLELSFSWDISGTGFNGYPVASVGFAFLESPGIPFDGIDNDGDGLIDEQRDNEAMQMVGPLDGITDIQAFLDFYGMNLEDLKDHWDADEDQDWQDGNDANGNGIYDSGEKPGDDVGLDGIGPGEPNYPGPDADGTECNHRPDYVEGLNAEPNFAITGLCGRVERRTKLCDYRCIRIRHAGAISLSVIPPPAW
jgi:hypothetical protein